MVHIMEDRSMTVDFDGIVEADIIRSKMIHMILEGYMRVYRKALEEAISAGKRKD